MGQTAVTRAGLPQEVADPGMPPLERVRLALPYLPNIQNTTLGLLLRWLLRDLYGLPDLNEANLERAFSVVQEKAQSPAWQEEVLRQHCRIEKSITVEHRGRSCSPALLKGREMVPTSLLSGKHTPLQMLRDIEKSYGKDIRSAADYRELLAGFVRTEPIADYKFFALWTPPSLTPRLSQEKVVTRIIGKARAGEALSPAEAGGFSYFGVCCLLEELRKTDLRTIQWMVGAEVLPPHRSIGHWDSSLIGAMGRIAGAFEEFSFNTTTAADVYTQDLAILAKHVPNISVAGYWWHTLYPFYIRKSIETRLDIVPMNKIVGFFSDAYHCEWCYPKLKLVKSVFEDVLTERVAKGWYDLDVALKIVQKLFYDNPKTIYKT
jgi:hypothetical protein